MPCPNEVDHVQRITHLETIQSIHAEQIKSLTDTVKTLAKTVQQFTQLKWAAYGAVALYAYQILGLKEVIKLIL